ncbi:hypothetical protein [Erythrobacter sp. JK5]|uniref:hypothetical protein n=1 Tax=Erythrobacter sp. JK5 TaxID=2829500 RepID=UPI001BA75E6B|nr:hypothetical protein [Erythrobacter sp. JK5]QUL37890.1 hypothetical protein KDC96_00155 [Erythrobacter sp. JK5]
MSGLPYEEALAEAQSALERAKALLLDELAEYPTPISGCDAQYIRLISDRTKIGSCLRVMEEQPFVATPRVLEAG